MYQCDCGTMYESIEGLDACQRAGHWPDERSQEGDIGYLQKVIATWADEHFPERTAHDAAVKLMLEEIPEWLRDMSDPPEYADLVILILDIAHLKGIDIRRAVLDKMLINRNRVWKVDPATKLMRHVPDEAVDPNNNVDEDNA